MMGTSITFEQVNRKYSGIYECEATNMHGTQKASVEIHVHCKYYRVSCVRSGSYLRLL